MTVTSSDAGILVIVSAMDHVLPPSCEILMYESPDGL
jgi:hypothetical protein